MKQTSIFLIYLVLGICTSVYAQWSTDPAVNTPVCTESGDQESPAIANVGDGCTIITWIDRSDDANEKINAQKYNSVGEPLWGAGGVSVFNREGIYYYRSSYILDDGTGGAFISVWSDSLPF